MRQRHHPHLSVYCDSTADLTHIDVIPVVVYEGRKWWLPQQYIVSLTDKEITQDQGIVIITGQRYTVRCITVM